MDAGEEFSIHMPDGGVFACRLKSKLPMDDDDLYATFILLRGPGDQISPGTYEVEFRGYEPTKAEVKQAGIDVRQYSLDLNEAGGGLTLKK
jgi:hypothetical protein